MTTFSSRYANAAARFSALVEAVPADAWDSASPCAGWAARDVLDHVVSTEMDFLGQRDLSKPDVSSLAPAAAWAVVRDAMQSVLDDPATAEITFDGYFGPTTVEQTIDRFYSLDLLVHRWDLATATGIAEQTILDPDEVVLIRTNLEQVPPEIMRTPGLFGPAIEPAVGADATTQLMNFLGRRA